MGSITTYKSGGVAALLIAGLLLAFPVFADDSALSPRQTEPRDACDHYDPQRQIFWGDTHVHTALSLDAATWDTRGMPEQAYRFAKGERTGFPPYDPDGKATRFAKLKRPLDFAMVSDHAEYLGMLEICRDPQQQGYDSLRCDLMRDNLPITFFLSMSLPIIISEIRSRNKLLSSIADFFGIGKPPGYCGEDNELCIEAGKLPWQRIQQAAEKAYDRSSACTFTTFVGYEWTGYDAGNIHRNIVFRNDRVIPYAVGALELPNILDLWQHLDLYCTNSGTGCEVLAIPHNSNVSVGKMFPAWGTPAAYSRGEALLNSKYEVLVEIFQHKGDSECYYGPGSSDEDCAFEKLPFNSLGGTINPDIAKPSNPNDGFVRNVLSDGLAYRQNYGVNPWQMGIIAATDDHLAAPGSVAEDNYIGHSAAGNTLSKILRQYTRLPDAQVFNPGGLAGVWAEENSRDAIFSALQRREVYGTSGPRIPVRMFGGWDFSDDLCEQRDWVAAGYDQGVAMGGELPPRPRDQAPRFLVWATKDPASDVDLERIQIIKGWIDAKGRHEEDVYDVAGELNKDAAVDLLNCKPKGEGHKKLCQVWQDPVFKPEQQAWYYARVLQNPSCRWTTYSCNNEGVNCDNPDTYVGKGLEGCCDKNIPKTIRERAWSSPIWYYPVSATAKSLSDN